MSFILISAICPKLTRIMKKFFGISPTREDVAFGVEIELTALPKDPSWSPTPDKWKYYQRGYNALASEMAERGLEVNRIEFSRNGGFKKKPGSYEKWFLTHDTSVTGRDDEKASECSLEVLGIQSRRF